MKDYKPNLPENVVILIKESNETNGIPYGYVFDPKNTRVLENARNELYTLTDTGAIGNLRKLEPVEVYTENYGFTVSIHGCNIEKVRGVKRYEWKLLIEKGDIEFLTNVTQEGLERMLKQSTVINGVIQEKSSLSPFNYSVVAIHPKMKEWDNTLQKQRLKDSQIKVSKTKRWEKGKSYYSVLNKDLYLGKIYHWLGLSYSEERYTEHSNKGMMEIHCYYKILSNPVEYISKLPMKGISYAFEDVISGLENRSINLISDLYAELGKEIDRIEEIGIVTCECINYFTSDQWLLKNTIARQIGEIEVLDDDRDDNCKKAFFKKLRQKYFDKLKSGMRMYNKVSSQNIWFSASINDRPVFSEQEKDLIMTKVSRRVHIDFGDGVYMEGRGV